MNIRQEQFYVALTWCFLIVMSGCGVSRQGQEIEYGTCGNGFLDRIAAEEASRGQHLFLASNDERICVAGENGQIQCWQDGSRQTTARSQFIHRISRISLNSGTLVFAKNDVGQTISYVVDSSTSNWIFNHVWDERSWDHIVLHKDGICGRDRVLQQWRCDRVDQPMQSEINVHTLVQYEEAFSRFRFNENHYDLVDVSKGSICLLDVEGHLQCLGQLPGINVPHDAQRVEDYVWLSSPMMQGAYDLIAVGKDRVCAESGEGDIQCVGRDNLNEQQAVSIEEGYYVDQVHLNENISLLRTDSNFSCALTQEHRLFCFNASEANVFLIAEEIEDFAFSKYEICVKRIDSTFACSLKNYLQFSQVNELDPVRHICSIVERIVWQDVRL